MRTDDEIAQALYEIFGADKKGLWPWSEKKESTKGKWLKRARAIRFFIDSGGRE